MISQPSGFSPQTFSASFFSLALSLIRRGLPAHLWLVFRPVMSAERGWQLLRLRRPRRKSRARNIYREKGLALAFICALGACGCFHNQPLVRPTNQRISPQTAATRQLGVDYRKPTFGSCTLAALSSGKLQTSEKWGKGICKRQDLNNNQDGDIFSSQLFTSLLRPRPKSKN